MNDSFEAHYRKSVEGCAKLALGIFISQSVLGICSLAASTQTAIPIIRGLCLVAALVSAGSSSLWWRKYRSLRDKLKQHERASRAQEEARAQWANDAVGGAMESYHAWRAANAKAKTTDRCSPGPLPELP